MVGAPRGGLINGCWKTQLMSSHHQSRVKSKTDARQKRAGMASGAFTRPPYCHPALGRLSNVALTCTVSESARTINGGHTAAVHRNSMGARVWEFTGGKHRSSDGRPAGHSSAIHPSVRPPVHLTRACNQPTTRSITKATRTGRRTTILHTTRNKSRAETPGGFTTFPTSQETTNCLTTPRFRVLGHTKRRPVSE